MIDIARSVLVVIDVQNGFVRSKSAHVVPAIVGLVRFWEAAGGPTVFTRFVNYPGSPYERLIHWSRLTTSPEIDIVADLLPYAARAAAVVDKGGYTLFSARGSEVIAGGGWSDLVICGLATESCVCKTAADAFERDLTPWVVTDACGSHAGPEAHQAGLLVTSRFIGANQMITTADLMAATGVAGHAPGSTTTTHRADEAGTRSP